MIIRQITEEIRKIIAKSSTSQKVAIYLLKSYFVRKQLKLDKSTEQRI